MQNSKTGDSNNFFKRHKTPRRLLNIAVWLSGETYPSTLWIPPLHRAPHMEDTPPPPPMRSSPLLWKELVSSRADGLVRLALILPCLLPPVHCVRNCMSKLTCQCNGPAEMMTQEEIVLFVSELFSCFHFWLSTGFGYQNEYSFLGSRYI